MRQRGVCGNVEWKELVECVHQVEAMGQEAMAARMMQECCTALKLAEHCMCVCRWRRSLIPSPYFHSDFCLQVGMEMGTGYEASGSSALSVR